MALTQASEGGLKISNAGTDGQYLQKQSGNDGGLTWATPTNTDTQLTTEQVQDIVGGMVTGNTETGITVTYEDGDGTLDFVVGTLNQNTTGTAAIATEITATANNSTDETVYPTFVDGATGTQGIETDSGLTYNPSTGLLTAVGLTLSGDLTVGGTTTTINSTTLTVDDKNIELGSVASPSDTTADGGGITLKGATDKTITWTDSTDTWDFNQNIKITGGGSLKLETDAEGVKTYGRFYSAGTYAYIESSSTTNSTITLRKSASGADSIDYMQCRDNSNALKYKISGTGAVEANTVNANTFTSAGSVLDSKGDVRKIPLQDESGGAYTLVASDAGQAVHCHSSTTAVTVNPGVFAAGDAVTIVNGGGSAMTISQGTATVDGSSVTFSLRNSADATSGQRSLASYGMATIWFSGHHVGYISGAGLS